MTESLKDRRYRRTQKQLEAALIILLKDKSINEISVRELSELADINRATFYLHYKTPNELLTYMENKLFDIIFISYHNHNLENPAAFFLSLYQTLYENAELSKVLLTPNRGSLFWDMASQKIKNEYLSLWANKLHGLSTNAVDYFATFIVDGYLAVIKTWLLNGMKESPEEMVQLTTQFEYTVK